MFFVFTLALTAIVVSLSVFALRYVIDGTSRGRAAKLLILVDLAAVFAPLAMRNTGIFAEVLRLSLFLYTAQAVFFVLVLVAAGIRTVKDKFTSPVSPLDPERRRLLKKAILYPAGALAVAGYGSFWESERTTEREYQIPVADLPDNLRGFRLAQLSDVHLGAFCPLVKLQKLLDRTVAAHPDMLVLTGDIFDDVTLNDAAIGLVDSYTDKFPCGIWYCHGNHEYFRGIKHIESLLRQTGIHLLVNTAQTVIDGERPLVALGVDYPKHREETLFLADKRAYVNDAMAHVPPNAVTILLAHHPEFIDDGAEHNIPLTLTGHTHGGQICLFGYPLFPLFKYNRGMIRTGDCYGYVHCGNGSWFPCRIGCPPEIAYFTLVNKT